MVLIYYIIALLSLIHFYLFRGFYLETVSFWDEIVGVCMWDVAVVMFTQIKFKFHLNFSCFRLFVAV